MPSSRYSSPSPAAASGPALLVCTGKYKDSEQTRQALDASGCEIVTVAIRRVNLGQNAGAAQPAGFRAASRASPSLPNTAGCYTADEAVRTLRLARELLDGHDLVKLEVLGDPHTLLSQHAGNPEGHRKSWSRKASRSWCTAPTIRSSRACWKTWARWR